jgi:hypothetical protein
MTLGLSLVDADGGAKRSFVVEKTVATLTPNFVDNSNKAYLPSAIGLPTPVTLSFSSPVGRRMTGDLGRRRGFERKIGRSEYAHYSGVRARGQAVGSILFRGNGDSDALDGLLEFRKTYFLKEVFRAPFPNWLIQVHGAAFSSWVLLLIV